MVIINIAADYTKTPGGRYIKDGPFSGEDFRERILKPKYLEAKQAGQSLAVILDGGYGYALPFLDEAFGGLARALRDNDILNISFVSDEEPELIERIHQYIKGYLFNEEIKYE